MKYEEITLQQCIDFEKETGYPLACDGDSLKVFPLLITCEVKI